MTDKDEAHRSKDTDIVVPEISLISSWYVPLPEHAMKDGIPHLWSLEYALAARVELHDLYFACPGDLPWFTKAANREGAPSLGLAGDTLGFAASLERDEIQAIAKELTALLTRFYSGPLVGLRPRIAALATYWPHLSLPEEEEPKSRTSSGLRENSVRALRNSLYLADCLGCRHVEIVGGPAVPSHGSTAMGGANAQEYADRRLKVLAQSLAEVYSDDFLKDLGELRRTGPASVASAPFVCVEIEPGESFLLNQLARFRCLYDLLGTTPGAARAYKRTKLNVDIAHMMLLDRSDGQEALSQIRDSELRSLCGHMHISDHTIAHAADLSPGAYHFFDDFSPWLDLSIQLCNEVGDFSRVIGLELEACNEVLEAIRARGRISRWVEKRRGDYQPQLEGSPWNTHPWMRKGVILVADVGNSTQAHVKGKQPLEAAQDIERCIVQICEAVHVNGGSVLSFTGDGVIGFFDAGHLRDAAADAWGAAMALQSSVRKITVNEAKVPTTLRISLHSGYVYIPGTGRLRQQAIGGDVVLAARLCDWLSKTIEPAQPPKQRSLLIAATMGFVDSLNTDTRGRFEVWGNPDLKGLGSKTTVYTCKEVLGEDSELGSGVVA